MAKNEIDAVEMTRKIRDAHYKELKNKSHHERIEFFRAKAASLLNELAESVHERRKHTNVE